MPALRSSYTTFLMICGIAGLLSVSEPSVAGGPARPDFNNDGYADLLLGAPGGYRGAKAAAGRAFILFGNTGGMADDHNSFFHQDTPGVPGRADANDRLGSALAWGDFDGNGCDDAVIGIPHERNGQTLDAGAVIVLYGEISQINTQKTQYWHQNRPGVDDVAETFDSFGSAVTGADFNGDGYDDLAIGAPGESVGDSPGAGAVTVLYGSPSGLRGNGSQFIHQDMQGVGGKPHKDDYFGFALASGDFNNDGFADLVIGAPLENITARPHAGSINVLYGSPQGLQGPGSHYLHQGIVGGGLDPFDRFGWSFAVGDFNGDDFDDVAVAAPFETGSVRFSGAVNVVYGSVAGLTAIDADFIPESRLINELENEGFGTSLAAGDLNGDGRDELIIGLPTWDPLHFDDDWDYFGLLFIVPGSATGINVDLTTQWTEGDLSNFVDSEAQRVFGIAATCLDYNNDGFDDLVVGATGETIDGIGGAIIYSPGTPDGIEHFAGRPWGQLSLDILSSGADGLGGVFPK